MVIYEYSGVTRIFLQYMYFRHLVYSSFVSLSSAALAYRPEIGSHLHTILFNASLLYSTIRAKAEHLSLC